MTLYFALALAFAAITGATANQLAITLRFSRISPALTQQMDSDVGWSLLQLLVALAALSLWLTLEISA